MRGATEVTLQHHQIVHLPRKMSLMIDPRHTWKVQYKGPSNRSHPPTSPNSAPAGNIPSKNIREILRKQLKHAEMSFTLRGAAGVTLQYYQIKPNTAPARKNHSKISDGFAENGWNVIYNCGADPTMIQAWSEHDPSMTRPWSEHEPASPQPAAQPRLLFALTACMCMEKCNASRSGYPSKLHQIYRARHEKWQLNFTKLPCHEKCMCKLNGTSPSSAPARRSDSWTSPNLAPATKTEEWNFTWNCTCYRNWQLNFTKYCTRHENWLYYSLALLFFYSTILYSTVLWLYSSFTLLFFSLRFFDSTPLLLYYYLTLLLFYSTILWLYFSSTLYTFLWLYFSSTLLVFDSTFLLLSFSLTVSTILWLYYSLTLRSRWYTGSFSTKLPLIIYSNTRCLYIFIHILAKEVWMRNFQVTGVSGWETSKLRGLKN